MWHVSIVSSCQSATRVEFAVYCVGDSSRGELHKTGSIRSEMMYGKILTVVETREVKVALRPDEAT